MKLKQLTITLLTSTIILTACNGGTSSMTKANDNNPYTYSSFLKKNNTGLKASTETISVDINFNSSIFISPDSSYNYEITDLSGKTKVSSGDIKCFSASSCLVSSIKVQPDTTYVVTISKNNITQEASFVGASTFSSYNGKTYFDISIDDSSTSSYISLMMQQKLENMFLISQVEARLFKSALSYKPNVSLSDLMYAYYIYLENNGMKHTEIMEKIGTQYKDCEQKNICTLDPGFINNPEAVQAALNQASQVVDQYLKDKKDSRIAEQYKWYKENIEGNINKYKDIGKSAIDFFFPGAGGKIIDGAGTAFSVIDTAFSFIGLDDSKAAYDRIALFNSNMNKYYVAATPNYSEILTRLSAQLLTVTVRKELIDRASYVSGITRNTNNNLSNQDIITYINSISPEKAKKEFAWIKQTWGQQPVTDRNTNVTYLTDSQTIGALATAYSSIINTEAKENTNVIQNTKFYNQLMIADLETSIQALQDSMYLDMLAITMKDKASESFYKEVPKTSIAVSSINLSGDYKVDMGRLRDFYSQKLNLLKVAYQRGIKPEKGLVAPNVLQSLEVEGKCEITSTDGLNTLSGICPLYTQENGSIKTKYISSNITIQPDKCMKRSSDGDGNITTIADARNVYGRISCLRSPDDDLDKKQFSYNDYFELWYDQQMGRMYSVDYGPIYTPGSRETTLVANWDNSGTEAKGYVVLKTPKVSDTNQEISFVKQDEGDMVKPEPSYFDVYSPKNSSTEKKGALLTIVKDSMGNQTPVMIHSSVDNNGYSLYVGNYGVCQSQVLGYSDNYTRKVAKVFCPTGLPSQPTSTPLYIMPGKYYGTTNNYVRDLFIIPGNLKDAAPPSYPYTGYSLSGDETSFFTGNWVLSYKNGFAHYKEPQSMCGKLTKNQVGGVACGSDLPKNYYILPPFEPKIYSPGQFRMKTGDILDLGNQMVTLQDDGNLVAYSYSMNSKTGDKLKGSVLWEAHTYRTNMTTGVTSIVFDVDGRLKWYDKNNNLLSISPSPQNTESMKLQFFSDTNRSAVNGGYRLMNGNDAICSSWGGISLSQSHYPATSGWPLYFNGCAALK